MAHSAVTLEALPTGRNSTAQLRAMPLFASMPESSLQSVARELSWVSVPAGAWLFSEGDAADCLYVVVSGRLQALKGARVISEMLRGEAVGEMALLSGEPRTASVRAARDSILVKLSQSSFERLVANDAQAVMSLTRLLVDRLRRSQEASPRPRRASVIGLVALQPGLPLAEFSRRLTGALTALTPYTRTRCIGTREVEEVEPALSSASLGTLRSERLIGWLSEQEERSEVLLLAADFDSPVPWTSRCLEQADTVLLLADARASPAPEALEALAAPGRDTLARRELVLLHPSEDAPRGTESWLEQLRPEAHHHVHLGTNRSIERLTRLVTGHSSSLVLGGGAARGFAHIGVYRALVEAGIPVDLVGGTSMGAVVAAQIALGWDPDTMHARTREIFVESGNIYDLTLPAISLIAARKLDKNLRRAYGADTRIEDLWTRFYCVSSSLTCAQPVIHERGLLWKWVKASGSLPGIAPPVADGENLLVDGGVLDNLPVDTARRLARGRVFAVNVQEPIDRGVFTPWAKELGPFGLLWRRFKPWRPDQSLPTILDVLSRTANLNSATQLNRIRRSVDLLFEPPVSQYAAMNPRAIDAIIESGYRCAIEQLEHFDKRSDVL